MLNNIEDMKFLWDGSDTDWVLVQLDTHEVSDDLDFVIVNQRTKITWIIEDEAEHRAIIVKMRESGTKIVTH